MTTGCTRAACVSSAASDRARPLGFARQLIFSRRPRIQWIGAEERLPPASTALTDPNGLVAAGSDLSATRLLEAYRGGIFPWYSDGQPVLWWSPDPRMVLFVDSVEPTRSLVKRMRQMLRPGRWTVQMNTRFEAVMRACAAPRDGQNGTWITDDIIAAYVDLHRLGHAHSVEILEDGQLVGGLYGVSIGRMFFGESMFTRRSDASKVALTLLLDLLTGLGFEIVDCQQETAHLASMGARPIPRTEFLLRLQRQITQPAPDWVTVAQRTLPAVIARRGPSEHE